MAHEEEKQESGEETAGAKPRFHLSKFALVVAVPSVVLGIVLLSLVAGGVYCLRKTGALQAEVTHLKKDLKERARVEDELREQIETLKTSLAAHAGADGGKEKKPLTEEAVREIAKEVASQVAKEVASKDVRAGATDAKPEAAIPPKGKRPGGDGFSCDITGKSPEEQASILKRCVGVMDAPPKARPAAK